MIDVYVKAYAASPMRACMASTVLERLALMTNARVMVHEARLNGLGPLQAFGRFSGSREWAAFELERFWIESKQYADRTARSEIYVVLDDDHLPIGKTWLEDGVATMLAHPDYAMLSSWSINGEVALKGPGDPYVPGHVYPLRVFEVHDEPVRSIGTPYFCRRQSLGTLPDGPLESYDQVLTDHVRKIGRVGFLRGVRHNHLGFGYSQVVPGHWGA